MKPMMTNGQQMRGTYNKRFVTRRGAALLAVFLCLLFCTGLLAGCGNGDGNESYYIIDNSDDGPTPEEEQAKKDALKAAVQTVKAERTKASKKL